MRLFNLLHTYHPQPILFHIGPVAIHWYGLLIAIGMLAAWFVISYLAKNIKSGVRPPISGVGPPISEHVENAAVYGIIFGLMGARLYHIVSELPYYSEHPLQMFMIWRGGLGIFGALAGAVIVLILYCRAYKLSFLFFADIFAPAIILAQAIGRWGNYFNSELFGLPSMAPWSIPIPFFQRPAAFALYEYFHPTFLYESLWNVFVFVILFLVFKQMYQSSPRHSVSGRRHDPRHSVSGAASGVVFALYLILYSFGRFFIEFVRIDPQPELLGLRLAQMAALGVFIVGWGILLSKSTKQLNN